MTSNYIVKHLRYLFLFFLSSIIVLFTGCGFNSTKDDSDYKIVVIPKSKAGSYWKILRKGTLEATRELASQGINVKVIWHAPIDETEWEEQMKIVNDHVNNNIDGILLAPINQKALTSTLKIIQKRKTSVSIIDSPAKRGEFVNFVGSNNYTAGVRAGNHLASLLNGKGNVIMLRHKRHSGSTESREAGFLQAISHHPGIQIISSDFYGEGTQDLAFHQARKLLFKSKKKNINGIFTSSQSSTNGMLLALEQYADIRRNSSFVGFDGGYVNINALNKGDIDALLIQNPEEMGYQGVMSMVQHLQGKKVQRVIDTRTILVDSSNVIDPKMQKFLQPYFTEYNYD